jgi:uncharacterized glyoxalase superfamily protein PhnB/uncharacterized protein YndB with AHSA1/START domain
VSAGSVDAERGTVSATVEVALPPEQAFRVFTAEIGAWYVVDRYTVVDHERTVDVRIEPRVGGRLLDVHDAATGEGNEMGRVTAWEPPRRFQFTDARATETEVRFDPVPGGGRTAVTLEQRGLDRLPPGEAEHVRRYGWRLLLRWFEAALASPPEELGLERVATMQPAHEEDQPMTATGSTVTLRGVSPYLYYPDAGAALDWLARVFGFRETARYVDDDGVVRESEMQVGDTTIQLSGGHAPGTGHGQGLLLIVHLDDVDAQHARVAAAGVEAPDPEQKPYGPRTFTVTDPWGYHWDFWQPVHDYVEGPGGLHEIRS